MHKDTRAVENPEKNTWTFFDGTTLFLHYIGFQHIFKHLSYQTGYRYVYDRWLFEKARPGKAIFNSKIELGGHFVAAILVFIFFINICRVHFWIP
jgi:hypothetical protein